MKIHFTVEDHNGDPFPGIPVQVAVENPSHLLIEETDADGKATIEFDAQGYTQVRCLIYYGFARYGSTLVEDGDEFHLR